MNMSRSRIVESPEGYFMSYRREYSIIKICIKDITNLVNPRSIVNQTEPEKKGIGKKINATIIVLVYTIFCPSIISAEGKIVDRKPQAIGRHHCTHN